MDNNPPSTMLNRQISSFISVLTFAIVSVFSSCEQSNPSATLVVTNANIWTGNPDQPRAQAMAVIGDSIIAVGTNDEVAQHTGSSTEVIDAGGKFITPGFIDTHVHLLDGGFNLSSVHLRDAQSPKEFTQRIADFAKTVPKGTWITGGEWDGSDWDELPSKEWIDEVTPDHPVYVMRLDGHMVLANSLALESAGVNRDTEDVSGGVILRNEKGELTGIFKDNAMNLISDKIPPRSHAQIDKALDDAMAYFASHGVTSVHNVWYPTDMAGIEEGLKRAYEQDRLLSRVYDLGALSEWESRAKMTSSDIDTKWLKSSGLKGVFDGALGSRTAAFFDPYADAPLDSGLFMLPKTDLYDWVSKADKASLQVAIHAIGDRAISVLLDNFEKIATENRERDRRFRVEHAQHVAPGDFDRFASLNVIPSVQPYHAIDDGRWAESVIGPQRIMTTYAFRSMMDAGATVAFSSDWPVAPGSVLLGIYAAVTRRTIDDKNPDGWVPEQKVTVEQALTAYTRNGAYASFDENIKGTLEVGKLADFVILSDDLTKIDPVKIRDLQVLQTYLGGKKVFDALR
jgi:predicted amidohydrolase YtcJ